jgi:hypothetical protein
MSWNLVHPLFLVCIFHFSMAANGEEPPTKAEGKRTDLYGDQLPAGAAARFGSVRLRHADPADVVFLAGGKRLATGGSSKEPLCVWDLTNDQCVCAIDAHASCSAFSPDGNCLAVASIQNHKGGQESVLRLFNLSDGKETAQFPQGHNDSISTLAFSPDGKTLACGAWERSYLFDCTMGRVLQSLPDQPWGLAFSPDGKTLVFNTRNRVRIWDVASGQERNNRPGDIGYNPVTAASPDGRLLATTDWLDRKVSLWDTATGRLLQQFPFHGEQPHALKMGFMVPRGAGERRGVSPTGGGLYSAESKTRRADASTLANEPR